MTFLLTALQSISDLYFLFLSVVGGSFPRHLSAEEESRFISLAADGDPHARKMLIEHNLRLVAHVTRKYFVNNASDSEDMLSIGTIGLIKAVDTYNPGKGTRFSSYASRCIENECLMYLRSSKKHSHTVSMSDPIETDRQGNELTLLDVMAEEDTIADDLDRRMLCERLRQLLRDAPESRELTILRLRFGLDGGEPMTQTVVAARLGISRSYISRLETRAMRKLGAELQK